MTRQIVLDTETTGLSPQQGHRIIEVGCVELLGRQLTGNNLHLYINPEREIDAGAIKVHGLTAAFLSNKPKFSTIIKKLMTYLQGAELIIHNAPFDLGFLNHELQLAGSQYQKIEEQCTVLDTLTLARHKHPGQRNSLDALCQRYEVDNSNRDLHGALLDSELLATVYLRMTGGQTQLFAAEEENTGHQARHAIKRVTEDRPPLEIIKPSADELQAHQAYLKMLNKNDDCLWPEE